MTTEFRQRIRKSLANEPLQAALDANAERRVTGRVTAHLAHYLPSVAERTAFVCGSKGMLKDVGDILVGLGMDKKKIKKEPFF